MAFNSVLVGYENYKRKIFKPDNTQPLNLMMVDVSATLPKQFIKEKIQTT